MPKPLPRLSFSARALRAGYRGLGRLVGLAGPMLLRRRLAAGRELPERWREKLGEASLARPEGRLIWLHAVGLGETLALRGLIAALSARAPQAQFLITSGTRASAEVLAKNLPPRARHQFMPLDFEPYLGRFLNHWRPDLVIWSEQDIWPGAIFAAEAQGIPQVLLNARITAESHAKRARLAPLYRAALGAMALVDAQEAETAARLTALGARDVQVSGSLKPAGPALAADEGALAALSAHLAGRRVWLAASCHAGDETEALAALERQGTEALLILAPREVARAEAIAANLAARGLAFARRSSGEMPGPQTRVWLADSYGEMGLWYRLATFALVGGGFGAVGGHNPWEAVQLGAAVLHGPNTANFRTDYALLDGAGAARRVAPGALAQSLPSELEAAEMAARGRALASAAAQNVEHLAARLAALIGEPTCR